MYIGIDMGGTKVSALVLDGAGRELRRLRRPTPASYDGTVGALVALVAELEGAVDRRGLPVGLGLPGVVDPLAGTVRAVNLPWLQGRRFGGQGGCAGCCCEGARDVEQVPREARAQTGGSGGQS